MAGIAPVATGTAAAPTRIERRFKADMASLLVWVNAPAKAECRSVFWY
jgi:hypothetical protein